MANRVTNLICHACLKQCLPYHEHTDTQNDIAVDVAREGVGCAEDAGYVQANSHNRGGQPKGNLLKDEHHDGEGQEQQGYDYRGHSATPPCYIREK